MGLRSGRRSTGFGGYHSSAESLCGPCNLLLGPAERADVVIDFDGVPAGASFILYNDATAPFPGGDSRNSYFTGDPDQTAFGGAPTTMPGFGPNTRTLLKIVVTAGFGDTLNT